MNCPQTPTLKRKSSHKRILISSPSQELLHFLTLPNPSANQDPRQRLHIFTPKNNKRSVSNSEEHTKLFSNSKLKPSSKSRISLIRKKSVNQILGKRNCEVRQSKLTLSSSYKKKTFIRDPMSASTATGSGCRLDFTFGFEKNRSWLKI